MSEGISVQKFYEQLTTHRANTNVDDQTIKALFLGGLTSTIKNYVTLRQPQTLQDTIRLALEAESICPTEATALSSTVASEVRDLKQQLTKLISQRESKITAALTNHNDNYYANIDRKMDNLGNSIR